MALVLHTLSTGNEGVEEFGTIVDEITEDDIEEYIESSGSDHAVYLVATVGRREEISEAEEKLVEKIESHHLFY